jgi:glycosyltransferase involved in cell wall biosynthesis
MLKSGEVHRDLSMNILFFLENTYKGGVDTFLVNLINHWPDDKDALAVVCNSSHPGLVILQSEIKRSCRIVRHEIPLYSDLVRGRRRRLGQSGILTKILNRLVRYPLFIRNLYSLKHMFSSLRPDRLVVVNGGHPGGDSCRAAVLAWKLARPREKGAIYNFHNLAVREKWFDLWFEWSLDWLTARLSDRVIAVSAACARSLSVRRYKGLAAGAGFIYNGITLPEPVTTSGAVKKELNIAANAPLCLMLASYERRKGHEFLLDAFRQVVAAVPDACLVICGFGCQEEIDRVKRYVEQSGIAASVRLLDFRSDKERFLAETDVLLVPSQAFESFGYTSVEAMAFRKPVVATTVGGIPEVVADGETGFCVDPDDADGFAGRIIELLEDNSLRQRMGEAGFQRYKRLFTAESMSSEYAEVIRSSSNG